MVPQGLHPKGLIGNAVQVGNSSRCCEFLQPIEYPATIRCWTDGKALRRKTSQKTCHCLPYTRYAFGIKARMRPLQTTSKLPLLSAVGRN